MEANAIAVHYKKPAHMGAGGLLPSYYKGDVGKYAVTVFFRSVYLEIFTYRHAASFGLYLLYEKHPEDIFDDLLLFLESEELFVDIATLGAASTA
jgi:hypothetical protein